MFESSIITKRKAVKFWLEALKEIGVTGQGKSLNMELYQNGMRRNAKMGSFIWAAKSQFWKLWVNYVIFLRSNSLVFPWVIFIP